MQRFIASFTPHETGTHIVQITFNSETVPGAFIKIFYLSIQLDRFPRFYCSANSTFVLEKVNDIFIDHSHCVSPLFEFFAICFVLHAFHSNFLIKRLCMNSSNSMVERYAKIFPSCAIKRLFGTLRFVRMRRNANRNIKVGTSVRFSFTACQTHTFTQTATCWIFFLSDGNDSGDAPSVSFS